MAQSTGPHSNDDSGSAFPDLGVLAYNGTLLSSCGVSWCVGHVDDTCPDVHCTPLEFFGRYGIAVTQTGGGAPKVSLIDMPRPQADFTLDEAPEFLLQFAQALAIAQRAATSVPADRLVAQVRALFPAAAN